MNRYALGIDVGTTAVKALLLDHKGQVKACATNRHGIHAQDGCVEADPLVWWGSVRAAVARLDADARQQVEVVGLSGNMSSVVLLGAGHEPVGPAVLLADPRGQRQLTALDKSIIAHIAAQTGNTPSTVFSLSTLLWLRAECPDRLAAARTWLSAKDYIRLRLTGTAGTELTDAFNSLLVSATTRDWDRELIAELDLPGELFAPLQPSAAVVGTIHPAAAELTGLRVKTPVVAGVGDMAALVLGAGEAVPGTVVVSLGTSVTTLSGLPASLPPAPRPGTSWHPLPDPARSFSLASLITGGLALNWLRELTGSDPARLAAAPLHPDDPLVFLPHLAGSGVPEVNPLAKGTIVGLRPSTTASDLASALFEAIAFELADVLDAPGHAADRLLLTGGGTHLPGWVDTITDVLQLPTEVLGEPEVSALGAARLALSGLHPDAPTIAVPTGRRRLPDPARRAAWQVRRTRYQQARAHSLDYYRPRSDFDCSRQ